MHSVPSFLVLMEYIYDQMQKKCATLAYCRRIAHFYLYCFIYFGSQVSITPSFWNVFSSAALSIRELCT